MTSRLLIHFTLLGPEPVAATAKTSNEGRFHHFVQSATCHFPRACVALHDDLVGVVCEVVEGALGKDGIVEQRNPLLDGPV